MAHLTGFWQKFLADLGNEPGEQQGNITVHLISPVEGMSSITGPSGALTIAAEAGSVVGAMMQIDGRHLFIPAVNIAGIVDTAKEEKPEKAGHSRPSGRSSGSASSS